MVLVNLMQEQLDAERRRKAVARSTRCRQRHPEEVRAYQREHGRSYAKKNPATLRTLATYLEKK